MTQAVASVTPAALLGWRQVRGCSLRPGEAIAEASALAYEDSRLSFRDGAGHAAASLHPLHGPSRPSLKSRKLPGYGNHSAMPKDVGGFWSPDSLHLWQARGLQQQVQEAPSTSGSHASSSWLSRRNSQLGIDAASSGLPLYRGDVQELEELQTDRRVLPLWTETDILLAHYVPVYVMLPLDVVTPDNILSHPERLLCNLRALKAAGVDGVMADIWWGVVEAAGSKQYDWSAYKALFKAIQNVGLKAQVVLSFHQCGGNTGDSCYIPLPKWVRDIGAQNPEIFFTNRDSLRNQEYLSFGIDNEPVLDKRTAVQVYGDFMESFRTNLHEYLEGGMISEIEVGLGPAGELRYPSYPETHGWRFPGIGEFQCYDRYLLAQLKLEADRIGQYDWGYSGPHDAGRYNDWPQATGFFSGSFTTEYGRFFLEWYSNVLLRHGDQVLEIATGIFEGYKTKLAAKVAGVHWWYNSKNHAAELAAGYYNLRERDGYRPIAKMLARHDAVLNFTCVEMRNDEQYWEARCGPEGLVRQVLNAGWAETLEVACENALPRYDRVAFDQILVNARPDGINRGGPPKRRVSTFTFLRLCPDLLQERNWNEFVRFVRHMHAGLDYHPEPEMYYRPRSRLQKSKPPAYTAEESPVPVASVPLNISAMPLAPTPESEPFFSPDAPGGGLGAQVGEISPTGRSLVGPSPAHDDEERAGLSGDGELQSQTAGQAHLEGQLPGPRQSIIDSMLKQRREGRPAGCDAGQDEVGPSWASALDGDRGSLRKPMWVDEGFSSMSEVESKVDAVVSVELDTGHGEQKAYNSLDARLQRDPPGVLSDRDVAASSASSSTTNSFPKDNAPPVVSLNKSGPSSILEVVDSSWLLPLVLALIGAAISMAALQGPLGL
eukprot:SM000020S05986  [mRNA]  locus=s20:231535:236334:- [translate_table: standard]